MSRVVLPDLRKIMGDGVYQLFTVDYINLAYNIDNKRIINEDLTNKETIDKSLTDIVTKIVRWYNKAKTVTKAASTQDKSKDKNKDRDEKKIDKYMNSSCSDNYIKQVWNEFKIMFIDSDNLQQINELSMRMNTGYICKSLNPKISNISLYQIWTGQIHVTTNNLSSDNSSSDNWWTIHYVY
jgi:hypothetical protein